MLRYKCDIMQTLKNAGYSTYALRKNKIIGEGSLTVIRAGKIANPPVLDKLCALLNCQPGDLLEYVPDGEEEQQ